MNDTAAGRSTHRLMALLLFVGVPAVLFAMTVVNVFEIIDNNTETAGKTLQVVAFERRLNRPAADGKPVDLSRIYLSGASKTLASANLQQIVVSAISDASGRLIETVSLDLTSPVELEPDGIRLRATLDIDNNGLLQLLYILESGVPLLDIETLSVRRLTDGDGSETAEKLRIDMLVRGYWRQTTP